MEAESPLNHAGSPAPQTQKLGKTSTAPGLGVPGQSFDRPGVGGDATSCEPHREVQEMRTLAFELGTDFWRRIPNIPPLLKMWRATSSL